MPDYPIERVWQNWKILRAWQSGSALKAYYDDPAKRALMKPEAQFEVESGRKLSAYDVYDADVVRTAWYQAVRAFFERYDYFLLPSAQVFPFDANTRLAEGDRRQDHGHLSPLDGGDDPGHHVELSGAERAGRLRRPRPADGTADRRRRTTASWPACSSRTPTTKRRNG